MIGFAYLFSFLASCFGLATAYAADADDYPLWASVDAVLDIIFPIVIVIGIILVVVGVIVFFIQKFNEQSITGALILIAVGIGLILVRALLGNTISWIAFHQMYPNAPKSDFETIF